MFLKQNNHVFPISVPSTGVSEVGLPITLLLTVGVYDKIYKTRSYNNIKLIIFQDHYFYRLTRHFFFFYLLVTTSYL